MTPLRHWFEDYEQAEFDESIPLLAPMMHTIALVWANSRYNTPARIVVLLQEVCNLIIEQVIITFTPSEHSCRFVYPSVPS